MPRLHPMRFSFCLLCVFRLVLFACVGANVCMCARLPALEDQVANTFSAVRAEAHLPKLTRIGYRKDLQQLTCTAAERGKPISYRRSIYQTENPSDASAELRKAALTKPAPSGYPPVARFAIAVWSSPNSRDSRQTVWVGVGIYTTAGWELFNNTFTDDLETKNDWKRDVSANCKSKR